MQPVDPPAATLRAWLEEPPSEALFFDIMQSFEAWTAHTDLAVLLDYAAGHMARWDDALRAWGAFAPAHPGWRLVRRLDSVSQRKPALNFLQQPIDVAQLSHITQLAILYTNTGHEPCSLTQLLDTPLTETLRSLELFVAYDTYEIHEHLAAFRGLQHLAINAPSRQLATIAPTKTLARLEALESLQLQTISLANDELPTQRQLKTLVLQETSQYSVALSALPADTALHFEAWGLDEVREVAALASHQLQELTLIVDDLEEETPLPALPSLRRLHMPVLDDCCEPEALFAWTHLEELRLPAGPESQETWPEADLDLRRLKDFTQLHTLDVSRRFVRHVDALAQLQQLKVLKLHGCLRFHEIDFLADLQALEELSLPDTIDDLSVLKQLPNLRKLELQPTSYGDGELTEDERLTHLGILRDLPWLTHLSVGGKPLLTTLDLSANTALENLRITDCHGLTEITGFAQLPRLRECVVDDCDALFAQPPWRDAPDTRTLGKRDTAKLQAWIESL